jgi:hypothetical protein
MIEFRPRSPSNQRIAKHSKKGTKSLRSMGSNFITSKVGPKAYSGEVFDLKLHFSIWKNFFNFLGFLKKIQNADNTKKSKFSFEKRLDTTLIKALYKKTASNSMNQEQDDLDDSTSLKLRHIGCHIQWNPGYRTIYRRIRQCESEASVAEW